MKAVLATKNITEDQIYREFLPTKNETVNSSRFVKKILSQ